MFIIMIGKAEGVIETVMVVIGWTGGMLEHGD